MTQAVGTITLRWPVFVFMAAGLVGLGAASGYLWSPTTRGTPIVDGQPHARNGPVDPAPEHPKGSASPPSSAVPAGSQGTSPASHLPDLAITLSPEMVSRAGIEVGIARAGPADDQVRLPGVVQPNGYRQVNVTPLVAGRITRVPVELGTAVRQGQSLAEIESPDLVDAQAAYVATRAELDAAHQRVRRTERLVGIGAASRQELEQAVAEHTRHAAAVEGARARLALLGLSRERMDGLTATSHTSPVWIVPSPLGGVVLKRDANPGLLVNAATELFTIADLSSVWVIGDVYEQDLRRVRLGSPVHLTTAALPGESWDGRVSYIDPRIASDTRTAQVRVDVPNRDGHLRLAMLMDMMVSTPTSSRTAVISRSAVQSVGDRHFVYLPDPGQPGRFIERNIRLGRLLEHDIEVLDGLQPGDRVVTSGSFLLRAERERLGLRRDVPPGTSPRSDEPGPRSLPRRTALRSVPRLSRIRAPRP